MSNQDTKDDVFAVALMQRDEDALAAECERRLREIPSGGSLSFRKGWDQPSVWSMPVWNQQSERPYARWGRSAARALLDDVMEGGGTSKEGEGGTRTPRSPES